MSDQKQPLVLGSVMGISFKVKLSDKSAVEKLNNETTHPVAHLLVVGENEDLSWKEFQEKGLGRGTLVTMADNKIYSIIEHFLPGLHHHDAAWRYEVNSDTAASRATVHTHLIIGHRNNFGPNGQIRRCVDDIRKPDIIAKEATGKILH